MKKITLLITCLFVTVLLFSGCTEVPDDGFEKNQYSWSTMNEGPYNDQISYATSSDLLTWTDSQEILSIHASVPGAIYKDNVIYVYFVDVSVDDIAERIGLITSDDNGNTWSEKQFVTFDGISNMVPVDPAPFLLDDGRIRMYYFDIEEERTSFTPESKNKIYSAISDDGINFVQESICFMKDGVYDPDVILVNDTYRMYVGDISGNRVISATSNDGLTFEEEGTAYTGGAVPDVFFKEDTYYLYTAGIDISTSINGAVFSKTSYRFESKINMLTADPSVIELDDGSFMMFYKTKISDKDEMIDDKDNEMSFDDSWVTVTVDDDGWVGIDPMIAVDENNNPHIAYYDQGNGDLKYAYFDGSNWLVETVDGEGDVGEEPGIDVDSNGIPHICYQDKTNAALRYATKRGGMWEITIVDSIDIDIDAMSTSLKVDGNDNIHVAYSFGIHDLEPYDEPVFRYALYDGSDWNVEHMRDTGSDMIIDVDDDNNPHISFKGGVNDVDRIMYATKTKGIWIFDVVDAGVRADGDTGIAVQGDGTPHIVYHDYENGMIKYATKEASSWTILTIADNQNNQEGIKIDVDANNIAHVAYSDIRKNSDDGILVYAQKMDSNWLKEGVYLMDNPAIVVDSHGSIHIAHNTCVEGDPLDYLPDYTGDQKEIEILKYSKRN